MGRLTRKVLAPPSGGLGLFSLRLVLDISLLAGQVGNMEGGTAMGGSYDEVKLCFFLQRTKISFKYLEIFVLQGSPGVDPLCWVVGEKLVEQFKPILSEEGWGELLPQDVVRVVSEGYLETRERGE